MKRGRSNRRDDGSNLMFISDLRRLTRQHLPEAIPMAALREPDQWGTTRLRSEVVVALEALIDRHEQSTGKRPTKSEVVAAALVLSMPVLTDRVFPLTADDTEAEAS